eukprot:363917-Chlamydomonas_euryale.AAC.11
MPESRCASKQSSANVPAAAACSVPRLACVSAFPSLSGGSQHNSAGGRTQLSGAWSRKPTSDLQNDAPQCQPAAGKPNPAAQASPATGKRSRSSRRAAAKLKAAAR